MPLTTAYELLSYSFSDYSAAGIPTMPTFTTQIASGTPVALPAYTPVSAVKDEVVATTGPNQLLAYGFKFDDAGAPATQQVFNPPVSIPQPFNLMDIVPFGTAGNAATFDALVGEPGQATYYQVVSMSGNPTPPPSVSTNIAMVQGNAVAVSASTNFDITSQKDATVGTDQGKLYHFDFASTPPVQHGPLDLTGQQLGAPVSIDTASMDTWVATVGPPNMFLHYGVPTLSQISATPFDPSFGNPVTVGGAKTWVSGYPFIVIAFAPNTSTNQSAQIVAYHGGTTADMSPVKNSFQGTPVGMTVTANGTDQFAWIATTNPNQVVVYDVTLQAAPVQTIPLPGPPIAVTVGLSAVPGTSGERTGMLHVAVAVPGP